MVAAGRLPRWLARGFAVAGLALLAACAQPLCGTGQGDVLPISRVDGKPMVPVAVNGRRLPFLLDTGASGTVLFTDTARGLGLPADPRRTTTARGIGGESRQSNALVAMLQVGQRDFPNLSVPVVTHSRAGGVPMAGLVGADLLRRGDLEIDFPQRRFVLYPYEGACRPAPPPFTEAYDTIPFDMLPNGLVRLRVRVNGVGLWALLDTGAEHSTMLRETAVRLQVPEAVLRGKPVGAVHGVGDTRLELRVQRFESVEVGQEVLTNYPVGIIDLGGDNGFDMVLGLDWIAPRRMWLSYMQQRLFVLPRSQELRKGAF